MGELFSLYHDPTLWEKGISPFFSIAPDSILSVLELKTLQCQKQTHKKQRKSWQGNFFWSKGQGKQTHMHTVAPSYTPSADVPAPCLGLVQANPLR
jgi:hypothetical protein